MRKGKNPTYNQRKFLASKGIDPRQWFVQRDNIKEMVIVSRYGIAEKHIKKEYTK